MCFLFQHLMKLLERENARVQHHLILCDLGMKDEGSLRDGCRQSCRTITAIAGRSQKSDKVVR